MHRGSQQVARLGNRLIESEWPRRGDRGAADVFHHRIDGHSRGDLARSMSAHAVGNHAQRQLMIDAVTVFVGRPDSAFVGDAVGAQHQNSRRGAA